MGAHEAGAEIANKRVALTPRTWATLSTLRKPGQTFDDTITELIAEHKKRLVVDPDEIDATEKTISWKRAKKDLGLA